MNVKLKHLIVILFLSIILSISIIIYLNYFLRDRKILDEDEEEDERGELIYQFCILPIPDEEQKHLNNTNPFNDIGSSGRDKGFDFEFWFDSNSENMTAEDLLNGYKLRRIVAPCDGKIEVIDHANDTYCPGYAIMIAINHSKDWITTVALETNFNNTSDVEIQRGQIFVDEGDTIKRGDLLAYFVVSNRTLKDRPNTSNPTIDWGLYPFVEELSLAEMRENAVCPYIHCIDEAKSDLEDIFRLPDGTIGTICVP